MARRLPSPRQRLFQSWFDHLWDAQSGLCALCGEPMLRNRFDAPHATIWKKRRPTFDHIHPVSKGGKDEFENLQLAHHDCNQKKADRVPT